MTDRVISLDTVFIADKTARNVMTRQILYLSRVYVCNINKKTATEEEEEEEEERRRKGKQAA